jgi:hypothetical protein
VNVGGVAEDDFGKEINIVIDDVNATTKTMAPLFIGFMPC